MGVVYILLLIQGVTVEMIWHQPQNIVSVEVNGTAVIYCASGDKSIGVAHSWYHKKWGGSKGPVLVKSCSSHNDTHGYVCKNEEYMAWLEISNVQVTDSGVYYCTHGYSSLSHDFGNGTHLNVEDESTSRSSIHIIGHLQNYSSSLMLACVVLSAHHTVHLHWNISGTYHKGQIISRKESNGTWTVMNFISLPKDNWIHSEKVTCEVRIKSSPTRVHWEISGKDELHGYVPSKCQRFLIPLVIVGMLLLLTLTIHLIRTLNDKKTRALTGQNYMTEKEITYAELNINRLTRFKKYHSP